MSDMFKFAST